MYHATNMYSALKYHAMKTYGGVEAELHTFLTSELHGGEWSEPPVAIGHEAGWAPNFV
jgi:hypothetical protein